VAPQHRHEEREGCNDARKKITGEGGGKRKRPRGKKKTPVGSTMWELPRRGKNRKSVSKRGQKSGNSRGTRAGSPQEEGKRDAGGGVEREGDGGGACPKGIAQG